jgi:hypothetical protein
MDGEQLPWRSFADPRGEKAAESLRPIASSWCVDASSVLCVLDHQGVIRHRWIGSPGTKVLDEILAKLIKEAEEAGQKEPR